MELLQAAKLFMAAYFEDGERHIPSDFDEDILGGLDLSVLNSRTPRWNKTIFCQALTELIDEGKVGFEKTESGYEYFKL